MYSISNNKFSNDTCNARKRAYVSADPHKNEVKLVMHACKQKVAETFEPIQPLFEDALQELKGLRHLILLPTFSSKKDSLYANRKRVLGTGTLQFENANDVEFPKLMRDDRKAVVL